MNKIAQSMDLHAKFLKHALLLAAERRGFCSPNPAVGAVVVKQGEILAAGAHFAAGHPHAEVEALKQLSQEQSSGATLYVSLEPCNHYGRTPPCTELLIARGIKAVYYGYKDPNPVVSGSGAQRLQTAGIECQHMPLKEIDEFYRSYDYWTQHKRPWVTAKLAMSLNGKIAGPNGQPIVITSHAINAYTHSQRKQSDAILTTCKTIISDDPQLNARVDSQVYKKPLYILDQHLNLPQNARIFDTSASITVLYGADNNSPKLEALKNKGIFCIPIPQENANINLSKVIETIGQDGVHDLWVEAGGKCWQSFISQRLAQRVLVYIAPKWLSHDAKSAFDDTFDLSQLGAIHWHMFGKDIMCEVLCSQAG